MDLKLVNDAWSEVTRNDAIGEIATKGYNVIKGYYRRPEATPR